MRNIISINGSIRCMAIVIYFLYPGLRGEFNKFLDIFVLVFKIVVDFENSVCYSDTSYEMTEQFLWFQVQLTATAAIGIHPTKAWLYQLVNLKNTIWTLEERYAIKFCFKLEKKMPCDESWIYCYNTETKRRSSQWKHAGSPRPKKAR